MEIWIPVIIALLGSLASYLGAIATSKNDLKKLKQQHELDLQALKEKHLLDMETLEKQQQHELNKMNAEIESQAKLYEQNKQMDVVAGFMETPAMQDFVQDAMMQQFGKAPKNRRRKN